MSNYRIIDQNILLALSGSCLDQENFEEAELEAHTIYLRFCHKDWRKAEECALAYINTIQPMVNKLLPISRDILHKQQPNNPNIDYSDKPMNELKEFFKKRVIHMYFPKY